MKKHGIKVLYCSLLCFTMLALLLLCEPSFAQCPMCKAAAESNLKEGGTHGLGLNAGILYLFCTPYLIVLTIGIIWWYKNRKATLTEALEAE